MKDNKSVLWFKEIHKEDIPAVGGKGANLGEMANSNFPIPGGFVVTSYAYVENCTKQGILEKIQKMESSIDVEDSAELNKKSKEIRDLVLKTEIIPKLKTEISKAYEKLGTKTYVAVRSSATAEDLPGASFAGQQETFLNVNSTKNLVEHVRKCWASLFTSRAIYYRKKQGFNIDKVAIAVVVQKMVNSEISGIVFTANPITNNLDEIVLEAGYGLGEAIVSGSVTPDTYIYNKKEKNLTEKTIAIQTWKYTKNTLGNKKENVKIDLQKKQKLDDTNILKLAKICVNIEDHYQKPMDIEWALENNELFIVQARPITTLKTEVTKKGVVDGTKTVMLKGLGASPGFATGKVKIIKGLSELQKIQQGDIMITKMTTPDMVPAMRRAAGIVTDEGGITCHAAIVSRELGIPAVVGTENATKKLKDGQTITVDASHGNVYAGAILHKENKEITISHVEKSDFLTVTKIKVNVAFPESAERASKYELDGVGLLRAEHMITQSGMHPAFLVRAGKSDKLKDLVKDGIKKVASNFKNKPVYYRTFDARTDEFVNLKGGDKELHEDNPMLGWHGIRRDLEQSELLKAQFKAIKELYDEGFKNLGVMIPFTIRVDEYKKAKELALSVGLIPHKHCFFGIMVETPAAALTIEDYINAKLDFISFGTNDLTQLVLGIDRNNEKIQGLFSERHLAILKLIAYVIKKCKAAGVRTSVCGQSASDPEMVKFLVQFGIDSLSVNIDAIEKIKETVEIEEKKLILEAIRSRDIDKRFSID